MNQQIAMMFLPDGRVGLVSRQGWYISSTIRVAAVADRAATANIVRELVLEPGESMSTGDAHRAFPDGRGALTVVLAERPNLGLRRVARDPDALCRTFVDALAPSPDAERTRAVDVLAYDLALAMAQILDHCRRMAAARLAGGAYLPVLEAHRDELRSVRSVEQQSYYETLEHGIGRIVEDEQYLLLSEDARVRAVYAEIQSEIASLYQWHMNLAKGGVPGPR